MTRKTGRFVIDTHVHAQRHAAGKRAAEKTAELGKKKTDYVDLESQLGKLETYDNSERLLYDMDCYGVDMCILRPAFGMTNELNVEIMERYPDKFRCMAIAKKTADEALKTGEWDVKDAIKELDDLCATGKFVGLGEGPASRPDSLHGLIRKTYNQSERMDELRLTMDIGRKYKIPVTIHTGSPGGYPFSYTRWPENQHPYWVSDLAAEYPDVPIIFDHGGMQGGYMTMLVDECIATASNFNNVYLETGLYWTDLYYRALKYPNVGPEKLMWGTDWGASIPTQTRIGNEPQSFGMQVHKDGIIRHQCDVFGWSLRQIENLDISQDDINLIVGGNALSLFHIDFPLTRMFRGLDHIGRENKADL
jgi:predicted TIM-barrel fold metal-dependent hydrolase